MGGAAVPVEAAYRFRSAVEPVFGAFFDAVHGFQRLVSLIDEQGQINRGRIILPAGSHRDDSNDALAYFARDEEGEDYLIQATPFPTVRKRNRRNGPNTVQIGNTCVVTIYTYWETRFRREIAGELGLSAEELCVPLFGDLRRLRNAIVHRDGHIGEDAARLEVVDWLHADGRIAFDEGKMIWLKRAIDDFAHSASTYRAAPPADR